MVLRGIVTMSNDVIFCQTRYQDIGYASYRDYWKLVRLAGYPIIYVDEIPRYDAKDKTFIICPVNGEWNTWPKGFTQGRLILYQLEWNIDGQHNTPACVSEVWNADKAHAEANGFRYVPMGSDEGLCEEGWKSRYLSGKNDVIQISYQTPRRQVITRQLSELGLSIAPNENLWGILRSVQLMNSEVMVHTHQTEQTNGVAPLRWCLAAAHHLPLISEIIPDRGIFGFTHMMQADYAHLAKFTKQVLEDKRLLADYAAALHGLLCVDYTFKRAIEKHV